MSIAGDPRLRWSELGPDARTAAYDNNAAVADSAALIRRRDQRAAAYRARHAGHLDLPYGPGERQRWDLYPAADPAAPCLVFVHGGYWQRNGREQFAHLAAGVAAHGWSFAVVGYPLAPRYRLGAMVAALNRALTHLDRHGPAHGIAGPVVLAGWSAGAQLTALALAHPTVTAGLAISGVHDLEPLAQTSIGAPLRLTAAEISAFSPLRIPPAAAPLTLAYAEHELPALASDSVALHRHRQHHGVASTLLVVPACNHFSILDALEHPAGPLTQAVIRAGGRVAGRSAGASRAGGGR